MGVIRGTTPEIVLLLPNYNLNGKTVYVTVRQPPVIVTLTFQ